MKKYLYRFCFSLLFFVPLLLFSQVIFSKKGLFFHYFLFDTNIDWWSFFVAAVKSQGVFPLWTNNVFMGFPFIANIEQGFFYPLNWMNFILPVEIAFSINIFVHIAGGVFFTYLYCRQIGISRLSSLIGGWVFMMNGIVLHNYIHLFWITSVIWMPLLLYFTEMIFSRPLELRVKYIILAGLTLGIQGLTGMFQTFYYTFVLFILYFLFKAFFYGKNFRMREKVLSPLLIVLISLGIFAVQFFPTYELITHSARRDLTYQEIVRPSGESLDLNNFTEMVFPNYSQGNYVRSFTHHYFGFIVFILLFLSLLSFKKNRYIQFFSVVSLIAIIVALGKHTPFYYLVYQLHLPGFSVLKDPTRCNVVFMLGFSILTAFGMDKIIGASAVVKEKKYISSFAIIIYLFIIAAAFFQLESKYSAFSVLPANRAILNPENFPLPFLKYLHSLEWREYNILLLLGMVFFISVYLFYNKVINANKVKFILTTAVFLNFYLFRIAEVPFRNSIIKKDIVSLTKIPLTVKFLKKDSKLCRIVAVDRSIINNSAYDKIENTGISWRVWMTRQEVSQILYERNNLLEDTPLYYNLDSVGGKVVAPLMRYLEFTKSDLRVSAMQYTNYFSFLRYPNLLKLTNAKYIVIPKNIGSFHLKAKSSLKKVYFDDSRKEANLLNSKRITVGEENDLSTRKVNQ